MNPAARPVLPLPGPLDDDPAAAVREMASDGDALRVARTMLASAVIDIPRGAQDERVITWLAGWDVSTIATIASLMRRCWQAGAAARHAELEDEIAALREGR